MKEIKNCPVNEQTADFTPVGRCNFYLDDGMTCPRHGDVRAAIVFTQLTEKLMLEEVCPERLPEIPERDSNSIMRNTPTCDWCGQDLTNKKTLIFIWTAKQTNRQAQFCNQECKHEYFEGMKNE